MGTAYRVIIWGPGEVGGAVARAAHRRGDAELVGAKVLHGADLGEPLVLFGDLYYGDLTGNVAHYVPDDRVRLWPRTPPP